MNMTYAYAMQVLELHAKMPIKENAIETNELKLARQVVRSGKNWVKRYTPKAIEVKPPRNRGRSPRTVKGKIVVADNEVNLVASVISEDMGIEIEKFFERTRVEAIRSARQVIHYITKKLWPQYAYRVIGEATGGMDHSTVMHSCDVIEDEISISIERKEKIEKYISLIKSKMCA